MNEEINKTLFGLVLDLSLVRPTLVQTAAATRLETVRMLK